MLFSRVVFLVLIVSVFISCGDLNQDSDLAAKHNYSPVLEVNSDSLELRATQGLMYHQDSIFTGTSLDFFPTGKLNSSTQYLHGKKHGIYSKRFSNGKQSFRSEYIKGRREGLTISWWNNGNIRSRGRFTNGKANGLQEQWYSSGAIFKKMNLVDGQEEGKQQSFRENGKLYNNYEAVNGRIFGLKRAALCFQLDDEEIVYED